MLALAEQTAPAAKAAMVEARAGRYGAAALEALTAGEQTAAAFLKGLDFFKKGQFDQAATQFSTAAGPRREYFPAAFYLGACYAAAGRDRDAAGVWQMAASGGARPTVVYLLVADARFRAKQAASVVDVLQPVRTRQPADDEVARRLALAYLLTGRYAEALPLLDGYAQRHAGDQKAAFGYVLAQYAVTSKAGVPLSGAEQAKVARLATTYKGADQPLLARYVAVLSAK